MSCIRSRILEPNPFVEAKVTGAAVSKPDNAANRINSWIPTRPCPLYAAFVKPKTNMDMKSATSTSTTEVTAEERCNSLSTEEQAIPSNAMVSMVVLWWQREVVYCLQSRAAYFYFYLLVLRKVSTYIIEEAREPKVSSRWEEGGYNRTGVESRQLFGTPE